MQLSSITKTIISVCTLVVSIGAPLLSYTTGWLPPQVSFVISGVVALAGSVLHYLAPNTTTDPELAKVQSVVLKSARKPRKAVVHKSTAK